MQHPNQYSPSRLALDQRRSDSEVKDILNDLDRLNAVPAERKTRWIWELIQNAKDCAVKAEKIEDRFVDIEFIIESNKLTFTHNSTPFTLDNLVSLITRTSDKEYVAGEGTVSTGKYGTGFVTSHVLNRKVTVSGLMQNEAGLRNFTLIIDRSFTSPQELRNEIDKACNILDTYYDSPPEKETENILTKYEYTLEEKTEGLVTQSMEDLRKNLAFVLLINKSIRSVSIVYPEKGKRYKYEISDPDKTFDNIYFSRLLDGNQTNDETIQGLFHLSGQEAIIAVPVKKDIETWVLHSLGNEVRLYKEFPLVGTEGWRLPYLIQNGRFLPPETRDGLRTLKSDEKTSDMVADENRKALIAVKNLSMLFFKKLLEGGVKKTYLLTESGLPQEKTTYTADTWFKKDIQEPLRTFYKSQNLLYTANKNWISIEKAKIPDLFETAQQNEDFYHIAVKFYGDVFPDRDSYQDWQRILTQDAAAWGVKSFCTVPQLAADIDQCINLTGLLKKGTSCDTTWLNSFLAFVSQVGGNSTSLRLYPNQTNELKKMQDVRVDPPLNPLLKQASVALGISFLPRLLHPDITHHQGVSPFERDVYYKSLNDAMGKLQPSAQTEPQFKQLLPIVALFRAAPAKERERWHLLIRQLLPALVPDHQEVSDMEDFNFESVEYASLRYACWLVHEAATVPTLATRYFDGDLSSTYKWLNDLLDTTFRKKETYAELPNKLAVVPMQDGKFRTLNPKIFAEGDAFDPKLKELYQTYAKLGDPKEFLVCEQIKSEHLQKADQHLLADPIDNLFNPHSSEENVEKGKPLHDLFHALNSWITDNEDLKETLFPRFTNRLPILTMKAYGKGMSKFILAAKNLNWQPEDFDVLQELNLKPADLQTLTKASKMAGGPEKLLEAARKIESEHLKAQWRRKIGSKAESSFNNVIADLRAYDVSNPDLGYDFAIELQNHPTYFVEIKSTVIGKPNVQMSSRQGRTARDEKDRYALCVVPRQESDTDVTEEYFKAHAKFVVDIGTKVKDKVNGMENGLHLIQEHKQGDVSSSLEDEKYSVYVSTTIWKEGKSYDEFVEFLRHHFKQSVATSQMFPPWRP